jgi:DNA polymerase (family 10)
VVPPESYGAALVYFTGSKEHNIRLRQRALDKKLRISEWGVFREEGGRKDRPEKAQERDPLAGERVAGAEEADVYAAVDLPWIPPELREDRGEVDAAAAGRLPRLLELSDLRGDLQMHSTWSDGKNSIEEMVEACIARGYAYMALTDHSKSLAMTGGLDAARLRAQWQEIDQVQRRHPEIRFLKSQEIDILADGSLDMDDETLAGLDVVLVSVHSRFELPEQVQTERILKAVSHPLVNILAHPTGRILGRRKPYAFDVERVLQACADHNVTVELNAHPERLDLKDTHLIRARELGIPVVISTDSHRARELDLIRYGVEQARRAWLEPKHVLNTKPIDELLATLAK